MKQISGAILVLPIGGSEIVCVKAYIWLLFLPTVWYYSTTVYHRFDDLIDVNLSHMWWIGSLAVL